jgi:hypothetical protein
VNGSAEIKEKIRRIDNDVALFKSCRHSDYFILCELERLRIMRIGLRQQLGDLRRGW